MSLNPGARTRRRTLLTRVGVVLAIATVLVGVAQPAFAAPFTTILGLPNGWSNSDITLSMTTDLSFDPTTEIFFALGDVCPPVPPSAPESIFWDPGNGWSIYSSPITISSEGTSTLWYWAFRYC